MFYRADRSAKINERTDGQKNEQMDGKYKNVSPLPLTWDKNTQKRHKLISSFFCSVSKSLPF